MSSTKTVREACDHGRYDKHMWSGPKTIETNQHQPMDWCRGGKEIVFADVGKWRAPSPNDRRKWVTHYVVVEE